jgi:autotransporter-associated beta strand protein
VLGALSLVAISATPVQAQQYFNGAQTTPNATINGGSGVWDNSTTNWTNATGTTSNLYDPTAGTVTVFGASASSTPATGGTVTVAAGGIQLTSSVQFTGTADTSPYTIQGGPLTLAAGGTNFNVSTGLFLPSGIISSNIVGNGGAAVTGSGTITFGGNNTYAGGTLVSGDPINGVVLQVTNNNAVSTGLVTLQNGILQADGLSNLTFTNNFQVNSSAQGGGFDANGTILTIAGQVTGNGLLSIYDTAGLGGTVVLLNNNTYSGNTFICSCGTLQLGDATHTASIVGSVTNEGTFNIVNANTSGITSILNDGGTVTFQNNTSASSIAITNFGDVGFLNNSTAGNATIVNAFGGQTFFLDSSNAGNANITNHGGVTFFGQPGGTDTSAAGNATITNTNGGGTVFYAMTNAGTAQITNVLGGGTEFLESSSAASATIVNNRLGTTSFGQAFGTDTPTAGNATIINNAHGETDFNAFSNAGSATIITNSGGATYFFDNSTGLNAQFITNGTGFVDFTESVGPNGDGRISAGSIAGSGIYYIGGGNTLIVGSNNLSTVVSGVIADNNPCGCTSGPGSLEKVGSGTLTLSGINTYTGTTTVSGGFLDVEGSIASSFLTTVVAGGALGGAGTVGNTLIAPGGIFVPGNGVPGSSMTVAGNLAFQSGALYLVTLNSTASTFANVTGNATLAGTVGAAFLPGSTVMKQYMILAASGGVSGGFAGAALPSPSGGLVATLSYDATHAYLNFAVDFAAVPGLNVNQRNVGAALTNFFNANGGIPVSFATLTPGGLTQASGELATGSQQATFDAMNLFLGLLTDPFVAGRGASPTPGASAPTGYASTQSAGAARDAYAMFTKAPLAQTYDPRWSVWSAGYGGSQTTDGNAALGSNTATSSVFGTAVGADYIFSPRTVAGFALAGGGTNFSVAGSGSGHSDLFQAGAFIRHTVGAAYVSAALAYGWQDITTNRTVTIAGSDLLRAQFDANAFSGRLEGGYRFVAPWIGGIGITPYAAAQFTTFDLPGYAEQALVGSNAFALGYNAKDVTDTRSELGIRADKSWAMTDGILTLRGRLAWAHDYDPDRSIAATFQTLPGASFVVNGAAQASDSALVTASIEKKWLSGWSAAATFEGEFSDVTRSYAGKGVVRYQW